MLIQLRSRWQLELTQWLLLQEQEHCVQELQVFSKVVELRVVSRLDQDWELSNRETQTYIVQDD
jgi:hypothetical protein